VKLRPEVQKFAEVMEKRLREHDEKKGLWNGEHPEWLLRMANSNVMSAMNFVHPETDESTEDGTRRRDMAVQEFADGANYLMMAHDNVENRRHEDTRYNHPRPQKADLSR